jgi:D-3-phosphoglycerate dehydrogenase
MKVIAWTFNPSPARAERLGVRYVAFDALLREADVVSLNVKLTEDTRGLIGARELALMKDEAILLNLPADAPILACEQVVLTPHAADSTPEAVELLNEGAVDNVIAFLEGRPQNNVAI